MNNEIEKKFELLVNSKEISINAIATHLWCAKEMAEHIMENNLVKGAPASVLYALSLTANNMLSFLRDSHDPVFDIPHLIERQKNEQDNEYDYRKMKFLVINLYNMIQKDNL